MSLNGASPRLAPRLGRQGYVPMLTAGFCIAMAIIIFNSFEIFRNLSIVETHTTRLSQIRAVEATLDDLLIGLLNAETGERGYILTGADSYLEPFSQGVNGAKTALSTLASLTSNDPAQRARYAALVQDADALVARLNRIVSVRRGDGFEAASAEVATGEGKRLMDAARADILAMKLAEAEALDALSDQADIARGGLQRAVWFAIASVALILIVAYGLTWRMIDRQVRERQRVELENWVQIATRRLNEAVAGDPNLGELSRRALDALAGYLDIPVATLYLVQGQRLIPAGVYAREREITALPSFTFGQGTVGQAAQSQRIIAIDEIAGASLKIAASVADGTTASLMAIPVIHEGRVVAVVELGRTGRFRERDHLVVDYLSKSFGAAIEAAKSRERLHELLEETQRQGEELKMQQEELRTTNEELAAQTIALQAEQDRTMSQQDELKRANEALEDRNRVLELQKIHLRERNEDLRAAQAGLAEKARELENASRYKSEFLANMSHELRTPLNSLLILSTLLAENEANNLSDKQVEFARTIHRSGQDLLNLINDILDLAKVEAGKLQVDPQETRIVDVARDLERTFRPLAESKGVAFRLEIGEGLPPTVYTDRQRLAQILKNLIANAVKFTEQGEVSVSLTRDGGDGVAIAVRDTGIGIDTERLPRIFEAFEQGDGSTGRRYGGTGLGLTISRELAQLLGCSIKVESELSRGSTFTLHVPPSMPTPPDAALPSPPPETPATAPAATTAGTRTSSTRERGGPPTFEDSSVGARPLEECLRGDIESLTSPHDRVILVVEDDESFGELLMHEARARGFRSVLATTGEAALEVALRHRIAAVLLDLRLPDISGLSVLERLKSEPATRHLPIHIVSARDRQSGALRMGAIGYLVKPVSRQQIKNALSKIENQISARVRRMLIVEDDPVQQKAMIELLSGSDVEIEGVDRGMTAIERLGAERYDCVILDLRLPDISGFELLERLAAMDATCPLPPVVVYTGKDLSREEIDLLEHYSDTVILKGARSPERLLDEVSLFLHRVEAKMPEPKQQILRTARDRESPLQGRHVLIVDDDVRNTFALANALTIKGLRVSAAKNGAEGLELLEQIKDIDLVLMDIMMPVMDGYQAMARLRENPAFKKLPVIALTAKAMRGDHEKCLAAGASDYLPKPIDLGKLISLLRVWLPSRRDA